MFELRAISFNERLSEETNCYAAKLYMDGKHIADVSNHGHGGADIQRGVNGFDIDALNREINATWPKVDLGDGVTVDNDLELICGDLLDKWVTLRSVKRPFSKKILFLAADESAAKGFRCIPYTAANKDRVIAHIEAKYPGARILNDMTDEQILELMK